MRALGKGLEEKGTKPSREKGEALSTPTHLDKNLLQDPLWAQVVHRGQPNRAKSRQWSAGSKGFPSPHFPGNPLRD